MKVGELNGVQFNLLMTRQERIWLIMTDLKPIQSTQTVANLL